MHLLILEQFYHTAVHIKILTCLILLGIQQICSRLLLTFTGTRGGGLRKSRPYSTNEKKKTNAID